MKVMYGLGPVKFKKIAVAIGIFDGVHRGHQMLIKSMVKEAKHLKAKAVVITFFPHPAHVLCPDLSLPYLMSLQYRLALLQELGVDAVLVIRFNKRFARIDPHYFIKKILVQRLHVQSIFVGEDFRFGRNRSADVTLFEQLAQGYGYRMHAVKALKQGGKVISSSRLRRLIPQGQLSEAQKLLGRPVSILGHVVHGSARGELLGYPTANVHYESALLPPQGVYAVRVVWKNKTLYGMANLGIRPSFKSRKPASPAGLAKGGSGGPKVHLEVHVFDFNVNLYGQEVLVEFLQRIRDEKAFPSKEDLICQIRQDEKTIRRLLKVE